jgi:hypothetical protein
MENPDQASHTDVLETLLNAKRSTLEVLQGLCETYGEINITRDTRPSEKIGISAEGTWLDVEHYGTHTTLEPHLETTTFERLGVLLDIYAKRAENAKIDEEIANVG